MQISLLTESKKSLALNIACEKQTTKNCYRLVLYDYVGKGNQRRAYIRYADDFVVLCESQEDCKSVNIKLNSILKERGLELSEEKTNIRHILDGFDFLGYTIRCYKCNINLPGQRKLKQSGYKILITPSASSLKKYKEKLKLIFKEYRSNETGVLISKINPIIRGWSNYFKPYSSRKSFEYMDAYFYWKQLRYGLRRHPNKGKQWIVEKYFSNFNRFRPKDQWVFGTSEKSFVIKHRWYRITRHKLIPNGYSPDNPLLRDFWWDRQTAGVNTNIIGNRELAIAKRQKHTCPICMQSLYNNEMLEKYHLLPRLKGGKDKDSNLIWLHKICHQKVTSKQISKEMIYANLRLVKGMQNTISKEMDKAGRGIKS